MVTMYRCDKCGNLDSSELLYKTDSPYMYGKDVMSRFHLCLECAKRLEKWLNNK